jgi:hypothetical protein
MYVVRSELQRLAEVFLFLANLLESPLLNPTQKPYGIDTTPILQFIVYTIVNIPINVLWQEWLEATFPGSKPAPVPAAAEEKKGSKAVKSDKQVRDVKNTFIKFAMDQSVGAAFNIPIFLATIGAVKGQGWEQILETVRQVSFGFSIVDTRRELVGLTAVIGCLAHLPCRPEAVARRVHYQLCCRACRAQSHFRQLGWCCLEHLSQFEG